MADVLGDQITAGALLLGQHPLGVAVKAGGVSVAGGGNAAALISRKAVVAAAPRSLFSASPGRRTINRLLIPR